MADNSNSNSGTPKESEVATPMPLGALTEILDDSIAQFDALAEAAKAGEIVALCGLDPNTLHVKLKQVIHALDAVMDMTFDRTEDYSDSEQG